MILSIKLTGISLVYFPCALFKQETLKLPIWQSVPPSFCQCPSIHQSVCCHLIHSTQTEPEDCVHTDIWMTLPSISGTEADLYDSYCPLPLSVSPSCPPTCLTPCLSQNSSGWMGHLTVSSAISPDLNRLLWTGAHLPVRRHAIMLDSQAITQEKLAQSSEETHTHCTWTHSSALWHTILNV